MARKFKKSTNSFHKKKGKLLAPTVFFIPKLEEAIALHQQGNLGDAEVIYRQLLETEPKNSDIFHLLGVLAHQMGNHQSSFELIEKAIEINPNFASYHSNLGIVLKKLNKLEAAVTSYENAITLKPDYAEAYSNLGNALLELKKLDAAVSNFDKAISLKPDYAEAYYNRGNAFQQLNQLDAAVASFDTAISLKPNFAEAYSNRGNALQELKQFDAAVASYDKAITLKSNIDYLFGMRQHAKMFTCNWQDFERAVEEIRFKIQSNLKASTCLSVIALPISLSEQRKAIEIWSNDKYPFNKSLGPITKSERKQKIRIGYYSADFHVHPVSNLAISLFELYDKSRFELIAFSFGPEIQDEMRKRITKAFNRFIDVRTTSDKDVAALSRTLGVDIAIDLGGHTQGSRTGIFSYRAAPIQVNYLGFPGTMGAQYMDFIIADELLIPAQSRVHYLEKISYLPNSYLAGDPRREISKRIFTRIELGLPASGFIFCCFNNLYKITPQVFDIWAKILHCVGNSVLWLSASNSLAIKNLSKEFLQRGLHADRIVFGSIIDSPAEHLARLKVADLFLDTFPYNAHATAVDALWAGLPILTCMGESFASRVAGSLLHSIGLPELATSTQNDYETMAIDLATNEVKLKEIKTKLDSNRLTSPLFDTKRFIKHLEAAYIKMYEQYQADLPPEHFYVAP